MPEFKEPWVIVEFKTPETARYFSNDLLLLSIETELHGAKVLYRGSAPEISDLLKTYYRYIV